MLSIPFPGAAAGSVVFFLVASLPLAAAQTTTAQCGAGFDWAFNSLGQSPCQVAAFLLLPCSETHTAQVGALTGKGQQYQSPALGTGIQASDCSCSTVTYSALQACAICQGGAQTPWKTYEEGCTASLVTFNSYPETVPAGTTIPPWMSDDVVAANEVNIGLAMQVADQGLPSKPALEPISQSGNTQSPSSAQSPSATTSIPSPVTAGPDVSASAVSNQAVPQKTNGHAIIGGVIGGILTGGIGITVALFFLLRRRRRKPTAHEEAEGSAESVAPDTPGSFHNRESVTWPHTPAGLSSRFSMQQAIMSAHIGQPGGGFPISPRRSTYQQTPASPMPTSARSWKRLSQPFAREQEIALVEAEVEDDPTASKRQSRRRSVQQDLLARLTNRTSEVPSFHIVQAPLMQEISLESP